MANGRCRMHGGASLGGIFSPTLAAGRYSRYLPNRLQERYEEAQSDPELLELRAEVALLDSRLADLLVRVDTGEAGALWRAARELVESYADQVNAPEGPKLLRELRALIKQGAADFAIWGDIQSIIEQRRRLVESERKRMIEMQQMITVEKAMLLFGAVSGIIQRHVTDRQQLAAIASDLRQLVGPAHGLNSGTSGDG